MNKTLLSAAFATLSALALAPAAQAAANSGTINITGKVVADTCQLNVNGTKNGSVALPTVTTATLNAAVGTQTGATAFNLTLTNCDTTATSASLNFSTGANNDATTGNLANTGTAGTSVEVQLLNGGTSGSVINVANNTNAPVAALTSGSSGTIAMAAQYYTKATTVVAGTVSTNATVTFSYQ